MFEGGPIRKKLRGATLRTIIKLHTLGYPWVSIVVDQRMNIVDWWEAFNESEAREKAKDILYRAKTRRPELGPYSVFLIETSRYGEAAFL